MQSACKGKRRMAGADVRRLFDIPVLSAYTIFNTRWRKVYRVSTKHSPTAKKAYNKLVANHKRGRFATAVGADVALIIKERLG